MNQGCHHCRHFLMNFYTGWYPGEAHYDFECKQGRFGLDVLCCEEDGREIVEALAKGDGCPAFEPIPAPAR